MDLWSKLISFADRGAGAPAPRARRKPAGLAFERLEDRSLLAVADLVAYRPVNQFIDYENYPVPEAVETDARLGPGIRVNGDDDNANGVRDFAESATAAVGDNDLVRVDVAGSAGTYTVSWTGSLAVWTSPTKASALANGAAGVVTAGQSLWVEYTSEVHTSAANPAELTLSVADASGMATDSVAFHSFQSVVLYVGGFTQDPKNFGDQRLGIFTQGGKLYAEGYDVHLFAHHQVQASGKGAAYNEVVSAVLYRNVDSVAILGHSWGGGAMYQLAKGLKANTALKPAGYNLAYTGYVDAIRHGSIRAETRKPPGSLYHDNLYQRRDWILKGNRVAGANNVNVSTTPWGRWLVHIHVDESETLHALMNENLKARVVA